VFLQSINQASPTLPDSLIISPTTSPNTNLSFSPIQARKEVAYTPQT